MTAFSVTWDYRCPFARNAHEHIVAGLQAGADWDVQLVPFSLSQVHVPEGGTPVWDDPGAQATLMAAQVGIVVRDKFPDLFPATHLALFAARHDDAADIRDEQVVRDVLAANGVDADVVFGEIEAGWPLEHYREVHTRAVDERKVFGVPTFVMGDQAVFVRITTRPRGDGDLARRTIDRVLDLLTGAPELNEYKHTSIRR